MLISLPQLLTKICLWPCLSFSQQISTLSSSCHYHTRDLRRSRNSLDHKTAATIIIIII